MGDTYPPLSDQQIVLLSKGARLPVYLLLCNHPEGMTQRDMIVLTGMNDRTISTALEYLALETVGMIKRTTASDGFLKWFTGLGLSVGQSPGVVEYTTPTTTINKDSMINSEERNRRGVVENTTLDTGGKSLDVWEAIWSELGMASVFKNERSLRMARLPHISAEYVKKHRLEWRAKKKGGAQWAGAFMTMLENPPAEITLEQPKSVEDNVREFLRPRRES